MGRLEPYIHRLQVRLANDLPTDLCWRRFQEETGCELMKRSSEMLIDGVEMGGKPEEVGEIASGYASAITELRELRHLTASSFGFLIIPMHAAMTGLLLFILAIITGFNDMLGAVAADVGDAGGGAGLGGFEATEGLAIIGVMITLVILTLTVANALVSKFAAGGHNLKIAWGLTITSFISGFNMLIIPKAAASLMGSAL